MKISYDYEEFIQELKEELLEGVLSLNDNIFVLRKEKDFDEFILTQKKEDIMYNPIIDWFYGNEDNIEYSLLLHKEEELIEKRKEHYLASKNNLIVMSVKNCLKEMEELNKII